MTVELIPPALTEATSPLFRPLGYSLFPPPGPATPAARDLTEIHGVFAEQADDWPSCWAPNAVEPGTAYRPGLH